MNLKGVNQKEILHSGKYCSELEIVEKIASGSCDSGRSASVKNDRRPS